MALSARSSLLQAESSASHGTGGYTTGSFTPTSGALVVVCIFASGENDDGLEGTDITHSNSLTLSTTPITHTTSSPGYGYGLRAFYFTGTGSSMTITADAGAFNVHKYRVSVYEYTGHDTGSPIGGKGTGTDADGSGAASLTLDATPASTSDTLAFAFTSLTTNNSGAMTPGADFAELFESSENAWQVFQGQGRTGSTSTTVAWVNMNSGPANSAGSAMLAFEVKESGGGGGGGGTKGKLLLLGVG